MSARSVAQLHCGIELGVALGVTDAVLAVKVLLPAEPVGQRMQSYAPAVGIDDVAEVVVGDRHAAVVGFIAQVILLPGSEIFGDLAPGEGQGNLLFGGTDALEVAALLRTLHAMDGGDSGVDHIHSIAAALGPAGEKRLPPFSDLLVFWRFGIGVEVSIQA